MPLTRQIMRGAPLRRAAFCVTLLLGVLNSALLAQSRSGDDAPRLRALQQEIAAYLRSRYSPESWGILTESALNTDSTTLERWKGEAASIKPERLTEKDARSFAATRAFLAAEYDARACHGDLWNVDQLYGIQAQMAIVFASQALGTSSARTSMIAGASHVPEAVRQLIRNLNAGIARGMAAPRSTVDRVIVQLDDMIAADGAALLEPVRRDTEPSFQHAWTTLARDSLLPALKVYRQYLVERYLSHARAEAGLASLPDGTRCYRGRVAESAGMRPDLDDLYEQAVSHRLQLLEEIGKAGTALFKRPMTPVEVLRTIRSAPEFVMHDPDSIVAAYTADLSRARDALPKAFVHTPDAPLRVQAIPRAQAATQAPARYENAPDGSSEPSTFLVNAYQPGGVARMNITMGVVHEAYPGHHFQRLYAHLDPAASGLPAFSNNGAYIEGWGIYAERLGDELGLFNTPLIRLGYLTHLLDVFMALQLDIGMHARGWTRAQVVDSMLIVAGRPQAQAESYADRHAASPGQLASYGIGYLAITQARERAERELGKRFDVRRFHDAVLSDGTVTLPELAERIDAWIQTQRTAEGPSTDEREVLDVVQQFFDAMRAKDTTGVRNAFEPGARLVGMRTRANGESYVQSLSVSDFVGFVGRDTRPAWTERAWNPEVRINGTLATVWAEYDFHFAQTFSHCGIDAVQLLKLPAGWKIVSIADTYTKEGCAPHPAPGR